MRARLLTVVLTLVAFPGVGSGAGAAPASKPTSRPAAGATAAEARGADALLKQIEAAGPPKFDPTRRQDREYVQSYMQQQREALPRRAELATEFVQKYPNHPRVADMLYLKAGGLARSEGTGSPAFRETAEAFLKKAQPKDPRAPQVLNLLADEEPDAARQAQLLKRIVREYPQSEEAESARGQLRRVEAIGKPFTLSFTDAVSGKKVSMPGLKGKVVVIDFWATWCGPCVAEMPKMKELYEQFKDKGVEFIGVSLDAPAAEGGQIALKEFVAQNQIPWPQYYQGKGWESEFSRGWGINSIPAMFVVDADGKLANVQARGRLEEILPELLSKRGAPVKDPATAPVAPKAPAAPKVPAESKAP
jgi:thiol-disulfide isomerase/thioredoxin